MKYTSKDIEVTNLRPAEKDWDSLEVGDVVVSPSGRECQIIDKGVFGKMFAIVDTFGGVQWWTKVQLKKCEYTIKQDTPIIEVTLEEIAKLKGVPVEQIRIKE